jgi:polar amino acid transport system substrate-binding protein
MTRRHGHEKVGSVADRAAWSRRQVLRNGLVGGGLVLAGGCAALGFGNTLDRIRRDGVVRVGHAGERPYAYEEAGVLVGATVAVHRAVFRRLGDIELQGVPTGFGELINGLNSGAFDTVAAGMFVTRERCDRAAFSDPEYCAPTGLLVRAGNPRNLRDLASVAANVVVLAGSVEESYARALGVPDGQIIVIGDPEDGLELVESGRADSFSLTHISLRTLLQQARLRAERIPESIGAPDVEQTQLLDPFTPVIGGVPVTGCGAAAFRRPDEELRAAYNRELNALRVDGSVLRLMSEYGFTEAEMPEPGITTEQLCRAPGVTGPEIDPLPR